MTSPEHNRLRAHLQERHPEHAAWPPSDFMHLLGNVRGALLYSALFVPEFVEIEGCIFLKELGVNPAGSNIETYSQRIREARQHSAEALHVFLKSCNWVEIAYLFGNHDRVYQEDSILADLIVIAWRGRLADQFPTRRFVVRIIRPDESGSVMSVGFEETQG